MFLTLEKLINDYLMDLNDIILGHYLNQNLYMIV
jgi:hypothetical protein